MSSSENIPTDHDEVMFNIYDKKLEDIYDKLEIEKDPKKRAYLEEDKHYLKEQIRPYAYNIWRRDNL